MRRRLSRRCWPRTTRSRSPGALVSWLAPCSVRVILVSRDGIMQELECHQVSWSVANLTRARVGADEGEITLMYFGGEVESSAETTISYSKDAFCGLPVPPPANATVLPSDVPKRL
jgi:hypothetical protein